jgi:formylglycine-generating enzyme required for sulfatase activity
MEYATRAGALTSRYFGETVELLPSYAWFLDNSKRKTWPVGSLKPYDLGLFDVQGNVFTWCHESYKSYPKTMLGETSDDKGDASSVIVRIDSRVLRGGSFSYHASVVRSAYRDNLAPASRYVVNGIRPARTFR